MYLFVCYFVYFHLWRHNYNKVMRFYGRQNIVRFSGVSAVILLHALTQMVFARFFNNLLGGGGDYVWCIKNKTVRHKQEFYLTLSTLDLVLHVDLLSTIYATHVKCNCSFAKPNRRLGWRRLGSINLLVVHNGHIPKMGHWCSKAYVAALHGASVSRSGNQNNPESLDLRSHRPFYWPQISGLMEVPL